MKGNSKFVGVSLAACQQGKHLLQLAGKIEKEKLNKLKKKSIRLYDNFKFVHSLSKELYILTGMETFAKELEF